MSKHRKPTPTPPMPLTLHRFCELAFFSRCAILACDNCWSVLMRKKPPIE